jgi:AmiR/NasT family two-component response regulator
MAAPVRGRELRAAPALGRLPAEASNLDVVVVTARDEAGETLIRELQRTRSRVRHFWPPPEPLPVDTDVLFCDLAPGLPARLPWLPGEPKAALVALIPPGGPLDLDLLRKSTPEAVLHRPFTVAAIVTSLVLAHSRFAYERRLRGRIERLDGTLRSTRSVERAKTILMGARSMAEDQAYHFLRSQAMERRVSVGAIAAAIVDAHDLLG